MRLSGASVHPMSLRRPVTGILHLSSCSRLWIQNLGSTLVVKSAADVKIEIQVLVISPKSRILSSTSFQLDNTL